MPQQTVFRMGGVSVDTEAVTIDGATIPIHRIESVTDFLQKAYASPALAKLAKLIGWLGIIAAFACVPRSLDNFDAQTPAFIDLTFKWRIGLALSVIVSATGFLIRAWQNRRTSYVVRINMPFAASFSVEFDKREHGQDFIGAISKARGLPIPIVRPKSADDGWFVIFPI